MSLRSGDMTTPQRASVWMASAPTLPSPVLTQLVGSMSRMITSKLNRGPLYSRTITRIFDGVGNMQLVLPDYPVTKIVSVQNGQVSIPPSAEGYGYRYVPWLGDLPGDPVVLDLIGGYYYGAQNVAVTYEAGYKVSNEAWTIPIAPGPYTITVLQEAGIWSRDNGVTYADGTPLLPVQAITAIGQYIPPNDTLPGLYTFGSADAGKQVLISYSFVPSDLEEATIQMIAERYAYRGRIGEIMKSLGGQETIRYYRGNPGPPWNSTNSLPPEVNDLIQPYVSVLPPPMGSPYVM